LLNFRNYQNLEMPLHPKLNLLIGPNAQGKTAVLEALYCLSTTRSFRAVAVEEMISFGSDAAVAEGEFVRENGFDLLRLEFKRDKGRSLFLNGKKQSRLSAVLGRLPAVVFSPDDLFLIKGGPSLRRRFLNSALIQVDAAYLSAVQHYERILKQRNTLLKRKGGASGGELVAWNVQLAEYGAALILKRRDMVQKLATHAHGALRDLTGGAERLDLEYEPSVPAKGDGGTVKERFLNELIKTKTEERFRGVTIVGPHRDDLVLSVNGRSLKRFGSQGQQRTAALALKLAELAFLMEMVRSQPLVLFDDVMSELDADRRAFFLKRLHLSGQAVLTGTSASDFSAALQGARLFTVENGRVEMKTEGTN
jgi:DNA replication and repair protein RecF